MFDKLNTLKTAINAALFGAQQPEKPQDDARARLPPRPRPILTKNDIKTIQRQQRTKQFDLSLVACFRLTKEYNNRAHVELKLVLNDVRGRRSRWICDLFSKSSGDEITYHIFSHFFGQRNDCESLAKSLMLPCWDRFNHWKVSGERRQWPLTLFTTDHRRQEVFGASPDVLTIIDDFKNGKGRKVFQNIITTYAINATPFTNDSFWLPT